MRLDELTASPVAFTTYHKGHTSRNAAYLPFVAWDGEGITPEGERRQNYVLFGNSLGYIVSGDRLTTAQCLELIMTTRIENPGAIHVGFSFSYDVEMMLADVPVKVMEILYKKGYCVYAGYRIEYKRGKWFQITKRIGKDKISARIWDVWGFFQCSFVAALKDNLPSISAEDLQRIEDGKAGRGQFTYAELTQGSMTAYMKAELQYLVEIMDTLRSRLYGADLRIRQWHGPGAIASFALKQQGMKKAMDSVPAEVNNASQFGFFGGRFELFQIGYERSPVYAYDIRSAYPSGMAHLPNLSTGKWRHYTTGIPQTVARFGIYRIVYTNRVANTVRPHPYPYRDSRHLISYPNIVQGWYWSPEAQLALSIPDARILEAFVFEDDGTYPFDWVAEAYDRRARWKREGNPSQMALKLMLNSMFGKTAQRVGWERTGTAPTWHQLEWAGYITSHARAKLFRAMMEAHSKDALLGVETDGIFTRAPLDLEIGEGLGQWECEQYDGMVYLQSGFYHKQRGSDWVNKYRGFDKGSISVEDSLSALSAWKPWENEGVLTGTTTRFPTMGTWLTSKSDKRNIWSTDARILKLGGDGKRRHDPEFCRACDAKISPLDGMHDLIVSDPLGGNSVPHHLPWKATDVPNTYRATLEGDEHA